jgi:hypothetical protein
MAERGSPQWIVEKPARARRGTCMRYNPTQFLLLLAALSFPVAGYAEDAFSPNDNSTMPRCGPQMDGQVYCKFGILYECELIGPNSMERRTGWRWKADLLRACSTRSPAKVGHQSVLPPEITYAPDQSAYPDAQRRHGRPEGAGEQPPATMHIHPNIAR